MLRLFTDTDTDITPAVAAEYGYSLISMPYCIDGNTVYPYEDFTEFEYHKFYDTLREGVLPTTSATTEDRYIGYFEPVFAAGDDIFYVHFSAAMTVTFDVMKKAVDKLLEKYPERKFYEVDTKGITLMSYCIVREIGQMFKDGKTPEEVIEWSKTECDHWACYFFSDDLKFFRRSGRVSGLAATMGTLLGIKPIIYMNTEGKMVSLGKEKGRSKALEALVGIVESVGDNVASYPIYVGHTDNEELAARLEEMLREKFGADIKIERVVVNPTAGSHCGPDTVGISFHSLHR